MKTGVKLFMTGALLCTSIFSNGQQDKIYSITACPGEDVSTQINISWAADTSLKHSFVAYTELKDKKLTRDAFLRAYHRPSDYNTFFEYVTAQQKKLSVRTELTTLQTHMSVMRKLKEYAPELHFDDITKEWLDDYFIYLRKELDNNDNTAYKNMAVLKKYVRLAYKDGYMDENPFDGWQIKKTMATCVYLTEEELGKLLASKKLTLSTAESCTGGGIAATITSVAGSSEYFMGGVVAYSNKVKMDLLHVSAETLEKYGAVSRETVMEMAAGAMKTLKTDCAIATSGIAGPGGGSAEKPVGTIWIAVAYKNEIVTAMQKGDNGRQKNVQNTIQNALDLLLEMLK